MVSFRFPLFPQIPRPPNLAVGNGCSRVFTASAAAAAALSFGAVGAGIAVSQNFDCPFVQSSLNFLASNFLSGNKFNHIWGSLSLSENSAPVTELRTGMSFPAVLRGSQRILGVGLRKKAILGLKNIDVYAYGVYADDYDLKNFISEMYGEVSAMQLKGNEDLEDLMESDVSMTIRLQIVYGRLSIRSVRSAFEESVGSRLQKFGGSDNKELLQRFTSQFKDEYKIPRGSIIDLSKEQGYVLRTIIDGTEVGSIESKLLCRSILDLYIGNESFDKKAREDVVKSLHSLFRK